MSRHAVGGPLENPVDARKRLKLKELKYYAHKYRKVAYYDRVHHEIVATEYIPAHTSTSYDMVAIKNRILNPLQIQQLELFRPENAEKLWNYIKPLLRPYKAFRTHLPAAITGTVLFSINFDGLWDNIEDIDFYPLFYQYGKRKSA